MDDLITFLRARLDEDERTALATSGGGLHWHDQANVELRTRAPDWLQIAVRGDLPFSVDVRPDFAHIARHDPDRVLREVEAKRRLIDLHGHESRSGWNPDEDDTPGAYGNIERACMSCGSQDVAVRWPCDTLKLVALPFSDRPGYQESWKP